MNPNDLPKPGTPEFHKLLNNLPAANATGKKATTNPPSDSYKKNFDAIFGPHEPVEKKAGNFEEQQVEPKDKTFKWSAGTFTPHFNTESTKFDAEQIIAYHEAKKKMFSKLSDELWKHTFSNNAFPPSFLSGVDWPSGKGSTSYDKSELLITTIKAANKMRAAFNSSHCIIHDNETLIGPKETVRIGECTFESQFHVCWSCEDEKHQKSLNRTRKET